MLFHSLYAPVELNKERGVIMEEINMYEDQPQERVGEFFEELLYGNQALAGRVIGEKEIIQKIGAEDMRDYVQNMYHARAMVVGIAGHAQIMDDSSGIIDKTMENRVGKLVTKYFGKVAGREENKYAPIREKQTKPAGLVHYKKTDQAHLILGVRAYDRHHPDRFALGMLATILGGNMSSRLFAEVREKRGLAYYVHAETEEFHDCGYLAAAAGVRIPEAAEAIKVILGEFGKVREAGVTEEELRRAKDYAAGKMALMLEDSFRVASFYTAQELLRRKIETPEEVLAQIKAVTPEDVRRVAKDNFQPQKLNLAVIGPFKKEGEFDRILKI
jgi:predicted Zn-dependent peptidase